MSEHKHSNPSPSHEIGAWCNGNPPDDPGCGQFIRLAAFLDRRQDEPPHESYLEDGRTLRALADRLLQSLSFDDLKRPGLSEAAEQLQKYMKVTERRVSWNRPTTRPVDGAHDG